MRLVYLDEAGVANRLQEPYLVACGVILNADQDYRPIEWHLRSLVRKYVHEDNRLKFIFHANEIWHGNNEFDRRSDKWSSKESRLRVLQDLADIIPKFHISIVCGYVYRLSFDEKVRQRCPKIKAEKLDMLAHAEAFVRAAEDVEQWMQRNAPREVAMIVAEDANKKKTAIKLMQYSYQVPEDEQRYVPFEAFTTEYIVDTVHFAAKDDAPMLQLADLCCFVLKLRLMNADVGDLYERIAPQIASPWAASGAHSWPADKPSRGRLITVPRRDVEPI